MTKEYLEQFGLCWVPSVVFILDLIQKATKKLSGKLGGHKVPVEGHHWPNSLLSGARLVAARLRHDGLTPASDMRTRCQRAVR